MSCNCTNYVRVKATSIAVATGTITITVPATTIFTDGNIYDIGLFTNIPSGTNCCNIVITNGTDSHSVMNHSANYFRPCFLRCRSVLQVTYLNDPAHFIINKIKGGKCC